ncbi:MAG: hypothetical protein IPM82_09985 [Saprospiraceae bacterium]|nr:hypothetical protein [Saprospiraceae bacterium]
MLADTFYLVGGHRFEGHYSANAGSSNVQVYANAIRSLRCSTTVLAGRVDHKSEVKDELNLHRRDYNLVPQIFENGESGISAFSGVFQPGLALLPFLNAVEIRPSGHAPVNGFSQFMANYHCAKLPLFSASQNEMHTLFFGGMSQYYLNENDSLIKDNRVPFVKTVSRVSRLADGSYEEVALTPNCLLHRHGRWSSSLPKACRPWPVAVVDYDALPDGDPARLHRRWHRHAGRAAQPVRGQPHWADHGERHDDSSFFGKKPTQCSA